MDELELQLLSSSSSSSIDDASADEGDDGGNVSGVVWSTVLQLPFTDPPNDLGVNKINSRFLAVDDDGVVAIGDVDVLIALDGVATVTTAGIEEVRETTPEWDVVVAGVGVDSVPLGVVVVGFA